MSIGQRVSELEGIRLKNEIVPWGHNFDPIESSLTWHMYPTGVHIPWKFRVSATFFSTTLSSVYGFAKGSRGGTWHVPRDKRHRRSGALAHLLVFVPSRSDRPFGRYSQKSLDKLTDWLTDKQARPSCKNPPYPEEISIHQNGLSSILLHYDFELEAICFEPLVS